jgi:hypothetical protein
MQLLLTFMNDICIAKRRAVLYVVTHFPSLNGKYVDVVLRCYAVSFANEFSTLLNFLGALGGLVVKALRY